MTNYPIAGFAAASLSPLAMTIGFIVWGKSWQSTAYALNVFKCSLAGLLFLMFMVTIPSQERTSSFGVSMIVLSSFIGIVIGDNTWLLALQIIGAKRVIVIDALKPFCAAFAAHFLLGEPLTVSICLGVLITSIGVVLVSTEKTEHSDSEEKENSVTNSEMVDVKPTLDHRQLTWGFVLAAVNVILDAFGSILTKLYGTHMNTWEINFVRFGFAAAFMITLALLMQLRDSLWQSYDRHTAQGTDMGNRGEIELSESRHALTKSSTTDETDLESIIKEEDNVGPSSNSNDTVSKETASNSSGNIESDPKWYSCPRAGDMTPWQWCSVATGVLFVTFLCPAMSNYALFQLPLSLSLTLNSLGPVYSIPLVYVMLGERSGLQAMIGAMLAVGGIALLCM